MAINPAIPVNGDDLDADPIRANFAAAAALETDYNDHKANTSNPHNVSAAQVGADPSGTAAAAVSAHTGAGNPHSQYALTSSLGTAAPLNVPASGDAAAGEVVKGSDSRLSNARTPTAHTHPAVDISDSTAAGRAILTAADAAAQRSAMAVPGGSGTSTGTNTGDETLSRINDLFQGATTVTSVALQATDKVTLSRFTGSAYTDVVAATLSSLCAYLATSNYDARYISIATGGTSSGPIGGTTINGLTLTALATGFSVAGGTASKTLTLSNTLTLAGTDGSTLNIGGGGTLGTGAFATIANYLPLAGGTMTGALNWATTQTIASAATTDIGAATSNSVIVSGTTTITGLGTIAAGAERVVQFSGALTLTHNATSLILPGGASIATAAGDVAYFVSLGSGNWRCTGYQKASGQAVVSSGGSPAGSGSELQYRNAGAFGAVTSSSVSGANVTLGGSITATYLQAQRVNNAPVLQTGTTSADAALFWKTGNQLWFLKGDGSDYIGVQMGDCVSSLAVKLTNSGGSVQMTGGWLVNANSSLAVVNNTNSAYSHLTASQVCLMGTGGNISNFDVYLGRNAAGIAEVNNGTGGTFRDLKLRSLIATSTITLGNVTVATLPTAASNTHAIVAVTDGNASPTYRGAVTGGGSTKGVVYCDGSSWMWH